jgi:hypothetical protein
MLIAEQLKKPPMSSQPKKALHNDLNNVTSVRPSEKKTKGRKATGELELFKEIAREQEVNGAVIAKHMDEKGNVCTKLIRTTDLKPENFSHIIPKSRGEKYRLDKKNIEIVSFAFHFYEHNKQICKLKRAN